MLKLKIKTPLLLISMLFVTIALFMFSVSFGSVRIPLNELLKVLFHNKQASSTYETIIYTIRLPRILASIMGGASLGIAGLLMQIFFRNPIVGPYELGISSGASLFVAILVLAGSQIGLTVVSPFMMFSASFLGALIVLIAVIIASGRVKSPGTLLIIGIMFSYLCSAITSLLMSFAQNEQLHTYVMWTMGSFSGFTWDETAILYAVGVPSVCITFLLCKPLNALLMGENYAESMGVNIKLSRNIIVIISSLLAALVTAFAGPIAFIGLAVPHMARMIFKTSENKILIPATILLGALITLLCDLIARTICAPVELPISAVTSFFGAPIIIYLIVRRRSAL